MAPRITRSLAALSALLAAGLLCVSPTFAADPSASVPAPTSTSPPDPPDVSFVCATTDDYLWAVGTDQPNIGEYGMPYQAYYSTMAYDGSPGSWRWVQLATLEPLSGGGYGTVVATPQESGATLYATWPWFYGQESSADATDGPACATGSLQVTSVIDGGPAGAAGRGVLVAGWAPVPLEGTREPETWVTGEAMTVDAGWWFVGQDPDAVTDGYRWQSTACGAGATTWPKPDGLLIFILPGETVECTTVVTYGYVAGSTDDVTLPPTSTITTDAGSASGQGLPIAVGLLALSSVALLVIDSRQRRRAR